jgi:hypothetical protein
MALEHACRDQLVAEAAGVPRVWPDALARQVRDAIGGLGRVSFQGAWSLLERRHPDLAASM